MLFRDWRKLMKIMNVLEILDVMQYGHRLAEKGTGQVRERE